MRLFVLALLTTAATAQPSGDAVLDAWADDWRSAARGVTSIEMNESSERLFEGPRGAILIEVDGVIEYPLDGRPTREARRVRVDGQEVDASRERGHRRRLGRAFGRAGREVSSPPALPIAPLGRASARRIDADGTTAWRVTLDTSDHPDVERAEAWFTRTASPRLLRLRTEGRRPRGGRIVRDVRYTRVDGLDLPAESRTTFTVRQRRRLREYVVSLTAEGRFRNHEVR